MHIVILGPPGAGKGTQGRRLEARFGIKHVDAGATVREHVAQGTRLGEVALPYVERAQLLPDDVMIELLAGTLTEQSARGGFVLDGFPRQSYAQRWLQAQEFAPEVVIFLELDQAEGTRRLAIRQRDLNDQGIELARRYESYERSTRKVLALYRELGLLHTVDAARPPDELTANLVAAIEQRIAPLRQTQPNQHPATRSDTRLSSRPAASCRPSPRLAAIATLPREEP